MQISRSETHRLAPAPVPTSSPLHFTGKPRDTETNLDYFGARYYSQRHGKVDVAGLGEQANLCPVR